VVTGTLPAGTLAVGDELQLAPGARRVAVRAIQSLGRAYHRVSGMARVAANLRGVRLDEVRRGSALLDARGSTGRLPDSRRRLRRDDAVVMVKMCE
jgi:selenocysteine-specific translation elongation factor